MDRLRQDLKVAIRALARQPAFTLVAVTTLALGVGATTAIFSVVYGILLKPLPYHESDRLVTLGQTARDLPAEPVDGSVSHVNFLDWQRQSTTIPSMALFSGGRAVVTHQGDADVVRIGTVTPDFFAVFRALPVRGRTFTRDENLAGGPRAVVVSHGYWQERLGGAGSVLGTTVEIAGAPWPIVGVAPPGFDFPNGARLWVPVRNQDQQCGRNCVYLNGIGRLADGVSVTAAQDEMTAIAAALERAFPDANFNTTVMVQTLHGRTVGNVQTALVVVLAAVAMVLLISCANVANLILVRGAGRQTELAVRTALGSGRRGLVSYLLVEHLVLALTAGAIGLALSVWGVTALKALAPPNLPRLEAVAFDLPTFGFGLAIVMAATLVFGLGPSLQLARTPVAATLGLRGSGGSASQRTRSLLLAAEVALSVVLLLGAGLLLRSLSLLQRVDLGFTPDGLSVFTLSLPPARYPAEQVIATHEELDARLGAVPGVTQVARISGLPLGPSENVLNFTRPDQPPLPAGQAPSALMRVVDADYFATLQIPVLAGRAFRPADRAGAPGAVIVSRRMADVFWPGEDPVGRPIQIMSQAPAVVVGVAANVRSQALAAAAQPEMYVPHAQSPARTVMYVIKSALPPAQIIAAAREVVRQHDTRLPLIGPGSMHELVDAQLARPRFYVFLVGVFAVLAVALAAVGVYGVVAYAVAQRTREIGVRMALGARRIDVVRMTLWQGLRPAMLGLVLGLAAAAAGGRLLQDLLYEIRPHDLATYGSVTAMLLAIVAAACAIPARRASAVPPSDALRS
jgi:putative ABC transport system permease protein